MLNEKRFGEDDASTQENYLKRLREESKLLVSLHHRAVEWFRLKLCEILVRHMERLESHERGFGLCAEETDIAHHSKWKTVYVGKAIGLSCMKTY